MKSTQPNQPISSSGGEKKGMSKVNQMKLVGSYIIYQERLLGQGQYGKVYEASEQNNPSKRFAVKVIPAQIFQQSISNSMMLQKEIEVLKKLRHENLVCLHEISQSPNNLYLFLDYCNGGDLAQYIDSKPQKRLSESEAIELFKQYVEGYHHLYTSKIIHRDIKPENLMLHNEGECFQMYDLSQTILIGKIKLGDFGFGRFVEGNMNQISRMSIKCTPIYASPQLLKKESYSSKCDVWSSGCLLYKMLYGEYPFIAKDMMSLIKDIEQKIKNKDFPFPSDVPVSEDVKGLLRQMFKLEEIDRISWEEIFTHSVFNKKFSILGNQDDMFSEQEKSNPIFQSIIQNRNHVLDNELITDHAQNFHVRNQKVTEQQPQSPQIKSPIAVVPLSSAVPPYQPYNQKINAFLEDETKSNNVPKPFEKQPGYTGGQYPAYNSYQPPQQYPDLSKLNINEKPFSAPNYNMAMNPSAQNRTDESPLTNQASKQRKADLGDEEDHYRNSLQKFQQQDMDQLKIGKVDKMILFLRNQALFADVTMQLVFTARNKYQLPSLLFYELIYSLTGFYNFNLDLLKKILNQTFPNKLISEDEFLLYLTSKQYKKTLLKIEKDSQTANNFFKTLSTGILKEVQQQLSDPQQSDNLDQVRDFEKFIKMQSANYKEYRLRFNNVAKIALQTLQPEKFEKDINSLRGIRGIQIFIKLDDFMPIQQFLTFDFRFFYDQYMNKVEADKLLKDIKNQYF